jgi:hypothetical protein
VKNINVKNLSTIVEDDLLLKNQWHYRTGFPFTPTIQSELIVKYMGEVRI